MSAETGRTGIVLGSWPLGLPEDDRFFLDVPRRVEDVGFDMLFVGDHLFAKGPNPDAVALLGACAALTSRVVIGTSVLLLPLRDPVVAAKQLATIDVLSHGRLVVGVGVGGEFPWEWEAMGIPIAGRGRRLDEYLALMRELWSAEPVDHAGPLRPVHGVVGSPRPSRPGGPPIWIGGRSDAALDRAAGHDGWCAYASSPRRVAASVERITARRGDLDGFRVSALVFVCVDDDEEQARTTARHVLGARYAQDFEHFLDAFCAVGAPGRVAERVEEFRRAGVDDILLCPQVPAAEFSRQVDRLAELVRA